MPQPRRKSQPSLDVIILNKCLKASGFIFPTRLRKFDTSAVEMVSSPSMAGGKDTTNSLQLAYKTIQQIAQALWIGGKDEELKAFHASLMAYCTIIQDYLTRISNTASSTMDDKLVALLSAPIKPISTANFRVNKDSSAKLDTIRSFLDFRSTPEQRKELVKSLAACEEELRSRYPDDPRQWAPDDLAPSINIAEPSYAVCSAAQSIFKALAACTNCPCTPTHDFGARLCLGTYRKPDLESDVDMEDGVDFDMFLSMKQDWHEVRIHAAKERHVRLAVDQTEIYQPKTKRLRTMKVKQLCEPIIKIQNMTAYRLKFKVKRDQLFKLQSERSNSFVDRSRSAVSLGEFLRDRTGAFTERTKRILAVILSSAVFHLHNTPWLQPAWNSSNVLFFRTASSAVPLRPFIQTQLSSMSTYSTADHDTSHESSLDADDLDPDDLVSHQCPTLVTLAMMLLEVYFVTPFEILAQRYNLGSDTKSSAFTLYLDVNVVFQACRKEFPDNSQFYLALENCLDPKVWEDEEGNRLDDPTLRTQIYHQVVLPLETELSQVYSSIPIDDLDRIAQEIDFASWGQTMHAWNQQENVEASQWNSLVPTAPCYPRCSPTPQLCHQHSEEVFNEGRTARGTRSSTRGPSPSPSGFEAEVALSEPSTSFHAQTHSPWAYTVGILCALPLELLAVRALFDSTHSSPKNLRGDSNNYTLGTMQNHMVVAACLPSGEYGTNAAADSASNMKRSFPSIRCCLVVGVAGGAPTEKNDIRLGDIVVSLPTTRFSGVLQYDRGKEIEGSTFELTGALQPPPRSLMTAISSLKSDPDLSSDALQPYLDEIIRRVSNSSKDRYKHPGQEHDHLFKQTCSECRVHQKCANRDNHIQKRPYRPTNHPEIHYGLVASGNRVIKDAKIRDQLAQEHGVLCFEMEAAGVMNTFPCLVIRGICDYADSYKNKLWQEYAAATAAAYAKLLLGVVPACDTH